MPDMIDMGAAKFLYGPERPISTLSLENPSLTARREKISHAKTNSGSSQQAAQCAGQLISAESSDYFIPGDEKIHKGDIFGLFPLLTRRLIVMRSSRFPLFGHRASIRSRFMCGPAVPEARPG